jgi:hypothetical protein
MILVKLIYEDNAAHFTVTVYLLVVHFATSPDFSVEA